MTKVMLIAFGRRDQFINKPLPTLWHEVAVAIVYLAVDPRQSILYNIDHFWFLFVTVLSPISFRKEPIKIHVA